MILKTSNYSGFGKSSDIDNGISSMKDDWVKIPLHLAKQHRLYGVSGWLILFLIGPFGAAGSINNVLFQWQLELGLSRSEFRAIPDAGLHFIENIVIGYFFVGIVMVYLAVTKSEYFIKCSLYVFLIGVPVVFIIGFESYFNMTLDPIGILMMICYSLIGSFYLFRSKRVRVTFRNEIRRSEFEGLSKAGAAQKSSPKVVRSNPLRERVAESWGCRSLSASRTDTAPSLNARESSSDNEWMYEQVAQEIDSGTVRKGLWTKLWVESGGDERETRLAYAKHRVLELEAEVRVANQSSVATSTSVDADQFSDKTADKRSDIDEDDDPCGFKRRAREAVSQDADEAELRVPLGKR